VVVLIVGDLRGPATLIHRAAVVLRFELNNHRTTFDFQLLFLRTAGQTIGIKLMFILRQLVLPIACCFPTDSDGQIQTRN